MSKCAEKAKCSIDWCDRPVRASNLCAAHEQRRRNGVDMDMPFRKTKPHRSRMAATPLTSCRISGCGRVIWREGLCREHGRKRKLSPGNWSGPLADYGNMLYAGDFVAPPEQIAFVHEEAKRRGVKKSVIMREALATWYAMQPKPEPRGLDEPLGSALPINDDGGEWQAKQDARIIASHAEGVPLQALLERFGPRVPTVLHKAGAPRQASKELPFGLPA